MLYFDDIMHRKEAYLDKEQKNDKPYDSAFKTVMYECRDIVYPLLNETFGESYDKSIRIEFLNEEHEDASDSELKEIIISDTNFIVMDAYGQVLGRYVYECQSSGDSTMMVRLFRYSARTAFEQRFEKDGVLHIPFPEVAVLYLKGKGSDSVEETVVKLDFPKQTINYKMKSLRFRRYTVDELFEKKLFVLLPFTLFLFDGKLDKINSDSEKLTSLRKTYEDIISRLNEAEKTGDITEFEKREVFNLLKSVSDALANKYENIMKEVDEIMGGQILKFPDTEALKKSKNEGRVEGRVEGRAEGRTEGRNEGRIEERINTLREFGFTDDKIVDDIKKKFGLTDEQARQYLAGGGGLPDIKEA